MNSLNIRATSAKQEETVSEERARQLSYLRRFLPCSPEASAQGKATTLYTISEATRTGMGGYVRAFAAALIDDRPAIVEVTWAAHKVTGIPLKEKDGRSWLYLSCTGTSRPQEVAEAIARALGYPADAAHSAYYLHSL